VVITIPVAFQAPTRTILELHGDLPHVPLISCPSEGRNTISSIDFEGVEGWPSTKNDSSEHFPESYPFNHFLVFIDDFSLLEVESRIWVHRRSLDEWLELVARVSWCSFNTKDSFNGFFSEDGVTQSVSNMREFLVFCPFNIVLGSLIVIIVMGLGSVL
jgi:hypothetical protein